MNIVIVGGGTAGWLAAGIIASRHKTHNVTVIESSKIGVIGVGESTTGLFTEVLLNDLAEFGVDHDEFIIETGATLKFGIKHKGWTPNIDQHYYGILEGSISVLGSPDVMFGYNFLQSHTDTLLTTDTGHLLVNNKSNVGQDFKFKKFGHALHIDATLTGKYFAKKCSTASNIKIIDSEVISVNIDERGIKSLLLSNNQEIQGDLFIDCSGMARVLINKLDSGWVSYKDNLPVDSAIPFPELYQEGEMPEPCTTAWAQKNGWMWQTPLLDRRGNGYVFSSSFTTPEKAQEEIETLLGRKINPAKVIKFDSGRKSKAWVKNCVAVGLSGAFLEPLEATSIHTTIVQSRLLAIEFIKATKEDTLNESSINIFNKRTARHFDDIKDFLVMHYMGGRTDSEFWKYISSGATQTDFVKDLLNSSKSRLLSYNDFPRYYAGIGWELYCYVMSGIGVLNRSAVEKEFDSSLLEQARYTSDLIKSNLNKEYSDYKPYPEFIKHFRSIAGWRNGNSRVS